MSEYWVAHKKYFCKYCNIYIADDVPSRRQHEGGLRHKGNVERFVRDLYKTSEKRKHDLEEEKREMVRVERAAHAAFAQDVGAGLVKPGSTSEPPQPVAGPSKPAKTDVWANYTTAASLGYVDPDEARLKAERERRSKEGVIGAWEVVAVEESNTTGVAEAAEERRLEFSTAGGEPSRKRESEAQPDGEDSRQFKLRKKKIGVGLGEIYDPGIIPIKLKKESSEGKSSSDDGTSKPTSMTPAPACTATAVPKWTARGWTKTGADEVKEDAAETTAGGKAVRSSSTGITSAQKATEASPTPPSIKQEVPDMNAKVESGETAVSKEVVKPEEAMVKTEEAESSATSPSAGPLFRKRKIPAGGTGSRGKRA